MIKIHAIHIGIVLSHFSWESLNHKMSSFHFHFPHLTSKVFFLFHVYFINHSVIFCHFSFQFPFSQPTTMFKSKILLFFLIHRPI